MNAVSLFSSSFSAYAANLKYCSATETQKSQEKAEQKGDTLELSSSGGSPRFDSPHAALTRSNPAQSRKGENLSQEILDNMERTALKADETVSLFARQQEWTNNPSSRWEFAAGAEAFKGHQIMDAMLREIQFQPSSENSYGVSSSPIIDEYGYGSQPPARIMERPGMFTSKNIAFEIDSNNEIHQVVMQSAPISSNAIETKDWVNLPGLTLDERKTFLDGVQDLINENGYELDARYLRYSGYPGAPDINSAHEDIWGKCDYEAAFKLSKMIADDSTLVGLLRKSADAQNGISTNRTQEYSITVVDATGKRLPDDQIYINSGDGSKKIQMSVEDFSKLDRKQITERLLGA